MDAVYSPTASQVNRVDTGLVTSIEESTPVAGIKADFGGWDNGTAGVGNDAGQCGASVCAATGIAKN